MFSYLKNEQSSLCKFKSTRKIIFKVERTVDACPSATFFHSHCLISFSNVYSLAVFAFSMLKLKICTFGSDRNVLCIVFMVSFKEESS